MEQNDMKMDCSKIEEIHFSGKFSILLGVGIVLTFIISIVGVLFLVIGIKEKFWINNGINSFVLSALYYLCMMISCFVLISIAVLKKPFSVSLIGGIYGIGSLIIDSSLICPHIKGYHSSGFILFRMKDNFYIDGAFFLTGIIILIFGRIIKYGLELQKEMNTIV